MSRAEAQQEVTSCFPSFETDSERRRRLLRYGFVLDLEAVICCVRSSFILPLLFVTLQKALDEKFAAIEEKDNEIHQLQLALREKERDLERLNNLLTHNNETINVSTLNLKKIGLENIFVPKRVILSSAYRH